MKSVITDLRGLTELKYTQAGMMSQSSIVMEAP